MPRSVKAALASKAALLRKALPKKVLSGKARPKRALPKTALPKRALPKNGFPRKVLPALCLLLALALVGGCSVHVREPNGGGAVRGGTIRLAVIPKAIGFDYWEHARLGAECAASQEGNVNVYWDGVTSEDDVSGQQNLLQDVLAQGVNGLVYAATDAQALGQVTRTALQQNTAVVNIDSGTKPQPPQVPVFATDNVSAAEKGGDLLAQQLGDRGDVAFIEFQPGTSTNETRAEGFKRALARHPGVHLVAQQSSESDYNKALQVTQDILTANPGLNGIYAGNEPSVLGAAEAVRQSGRAGQVKIIGWDTSPGQVQSLRQGVITGLIGQNPFRMGYLGVQTAVSRIRHENRPPPSTDTGSMLVTRENLNDPAVQELLNPTCAKPPR